MKLFLPALIVLSLALLMGCTQAPPATGSAAPSGPATVSPTVSPATSGEPVDPQIQQALDELDQLED